MQDNIYRFINQKINENNKKQKIKEANNNFVPIRCEDYEIPDFKIPSSRKQKSTREKFAKTLAFIDLNKQRRFSDCCTIMPIPSTEKRLISIYGRQEEVSRGIKFMKEIGLISEEDNSYQFNAYYKEDNKAKTYRYYIENEELVKQYCKYNNINKYEVAIKNKEYYRTIVDTFKIDNFDNNAVRFGKVHLLKPDNFSIEEFEDYITAVMLNNYPDLEYYQEMARYINEVFYEDYPDFAIKYEVQYDWNKGNKAITNIKIRATNRCVAAKKDNSNYYTDDFKGLYKKDILDKYGLNLSKDVKSSVPRLTMSLNKGYWIKEDIDIYYLVYKEINNIIDNNRTIVNTFADDEFYLFRDDLKALHLRAYFDSINTLGRNTCHSMGTFSYKSEVYEAMQIYRQAIETVEGTTFDNEIFFHESNIYMEVLLELLENGYFVWQVYDSWYARKDGVTQKEYEEYVRDLVADKANKYIEKIIV